MYFVAGVCVIKVHALPQVAKSLQKTPHFYRGHFGNVVKYVLPRSRPRESVVKYVLPRPPCAQSVVKYVLPRFWLVESVVKHVLPRPPCAQNAIDYVLPRFWPVECVEKYVLPRSSEAAKMHFVAGVCVIKVHALPQVAKSLQKTPHFYRGHFGNVVKYVLPRSRPRESVVKYVLPRPPCAQSVVKYVLPRFWLVESVVKHVLPRPPCAQNAIDYVLPRFWPVECVEKYVLPRSSEAAKMHFVADVCVIKVHALPQVAKSLQKNTAFLSRPF